MTNRVPAGAADGHPAAGTGRDVFTFTIHEPCGAFLPPDAAHCPVCTGHPRQALLHWRYAMTILVLILALALAGALLAYQAAADRADRAEDWIDRQATETEAHRG